MHTALLSVLALGFFTSSCNAFQPQPTTSTSTAHRQGLTNLSVKPMQNSQSPPAEPDAEKQGARVAFLGNSILYYNDCPRFLANLGKGKNGSIAYQDSCLRGGTNLSQLWMMGNGMMHHGFATEAAKTGKLDEDGSDVYDVGKPTVEDLLGCNNNNDDEEEAQQQETFDFVVFNDHTQGPARLASRKATQQTLVEKYLPLLIENQATPIMIETAAYRYPDINNSKDLGTTHEFQSRIKEGVQSYLGVLEPNLPQATKPRMAPVGTAFLHVHDNNHKLWEELFDPFDNFHPSPIGTFLQGCVLHCTMFSDNNTPPLPTTKEEIADLWKDARVMHHPKTGESRRLPSVEEVEYLWNVAREVCAVEC